MFVEQANARSAECMIQQKMDFFGEQSSKSEEMELCGGVEDKDYYYILKNNATKLRHTPYKAFNGPRRNLEQWNVVGDYKEHMTFPLLSWHFFSFWYLLKIASYTEGSEMYLLNAIWEAKHGRSTRQL